MKKIISVFLVIAVMISCLYIPVVAADGGLTLDEYGFVDVGETEIEYGIYGKDNAQPLLILTGNGGDMHGHDGNILPGLVATDDYKIIVISVRGTGKTALGTKELTFEKEAEDITKVLDYLGVGKTYIYGYSDGGNLALVFTLLYPERVEKLCVQSPNINIFGTKSFKQLQIMYQYLILCIECTYKKDPDYIRQREIKGMMAHQPNLKFKDLEKIDVPVLHIYAEDDMMYRRHSEKISNAIPNCKSLLVENATHTSSFEYSDTIIVPSMIDFFEN